MTPALNTTSPAHTHLTRKRPQAEHFFLTGWRVTPGQASVRFAFECEKFGRFEETVFFTDHNPLALSNILDAGLCNILDLLHIALGVSYYKCAAAPIIVLPAHYQKPHLLAMAQALYTDGLAEFHIRANLPFPPTVSFEARSRPSFPRPQHSSSRTLRPQPSAPSLLGRSTALIAFGGGKDSYVARSLLQRAGLTTQLVSCILSDKVAKALSVTALQPLLFIRRSISSNLSKALDNGAYNGHVPITAINALAITVLGYIKKSSYTVFANERSADEATMKIGDEQANHQYSKSGTFEMLLIEAIYEAAPAAPRFFSVLRPFSEIWIAKSFATLTEAHSLFTSCNQNFKITGPSPPRWCANCAKCAFTSLMVLPFMTRQQALYAFGAILPDQKTLRPQYRALAGLAAQKPWDCVGTIDEVQATLYQLSKNPEWKALRVVTELLPEILQTTSPQTLERYWQDGLTPSKQHHIPRDIWEVMREF